MTPSAGFTEEEWELLKQTPWAVGFGVMAASPSGSVGVGKEMAALTNRLDEVTEYGADNDLVEAVVAAIVADGARPPPFSDGMADTEAIQSRALRRCRSVADLLDHYSSPAEAAGFKAFLLELGTLVSDAALEGGFLGFGAKRASQQEMQMLQDMAAALRITPLAAP